MKYVLMIFVLAALLFGAGAVLGQDKTGEPFTVTGKTYCPLKYYVSSPNRGDDPVEERRKDILENPSTRVEKKQSGDTKDHDAMLAGLQIDTIKLAKVLVNIGQEVQDDQILATYEIPVENIISEKQKLSQADLKHYEFLLSATNNALDSLKSQRAEYSRMMQYQSISPQEVEDNLGKIDVQMKQRDYIEQILKEEELQYKDKLEIAQSYYGMDVEKMIFPKEGVIRSQLSGTVIWMNFDAREGKIFNAKTQLFLVGVLDPMVVRCAVHEIQALKLKIGDPADIVFHTMPDKVFKTSISKVSFVAQPAMLQQPSFYEIELLLPNPDRTLKEGLRCNVTITPGA